MIKISKFTKNFKMACNNNISNNCGNIEYAACTQYQGGVSVESSLDPVNQCLSLEETTQDIYNQLDTLNNKVGGNPVVGTVISVNNISPDINGNVSIDADDVPQGATNLYVTSAEKTTWNGKQDALGFTPVPNTRTVNSKPLTTDIVLNKSDIGLSNVQNIDTTIASNIVQTPNFRFVTDAEKAAWNAAITEITEITYANLLNLKNTSTLVKGRTYLITDYVTTYIQPVTLTFKTSAVTEPLYVTAKDINKLHNVCKSKLYPQDIIYYEITGDIGDGAGGEGFTKGKIYRRIDTLRNNDIGTDWRHIKYDRSGIDKLLFEDYTTCNDNIIKEHKLFNNVIGVGFVNNTIEIGFKNNTIGTTFNGNNIGQDFQTNQIGNLFVNNTIGSNFTNNVVANNCSNNIIGSYFGTNTIGNDFTDNRIKNSFNTNTVDSSFIFNNISNNFQNNVVLSNFQNNTIENDFITNTISNNFKNVIVNSNVTGINFTTIDIYNKTYPNTITRKSNNAFQFSYTDSFGDTVIENI